MQSGIARPKRWQRIEGVEAPCSPAVADGDEEWRTQLEMKMGDRLGGVARSAGPADDLAAVDDVADGDRQAGQVSGDRAITEARAFAALDHHHVAIAARQPWPPDVRGIDHGSIERGEDRRSEGDLEVDPVMGAQQDARRRHPPDLVVPVGSVDPRNEPAVAIPVTRSRRERKDHGHNRCPWTESDCRHRRRAWAGVGRRARRRARLGSRRSTRRRGHRQTG